MTESARLAELFDPTTGERHRNTEYSIVRDGRLVETQVYYGGRF